MPEELREALREVDRLIAEAENDPDTALDFDDAIQATAVCGGRIGQEPRPFQLTYYAASGDRWELALSALEIVDIADGHTREMLLYCCVDPACDSKFSRPGSSCMRCDFVEDARYGTFTGPDAIARLRAEALPEPSEPTRGAIISALGEPDETGGGTYFRESIYVWPWIKYHLEDAQLRVAFDDEGNVKEVSVLEKDWRPGP